MSSKKEVEPVLIASSGGPVSLRASSRTQFIKRLEESSGGHELSISREPEECVKPTLVPPTKYLPFVIPFNTAKDHMIAWRDKELFVPLDMTTTFRSAKFECFYCPYFLFSGLVSLRRPELSESDIPEEYEFSDFPTTLPCCAPVVQIEKDDDDDEGESVTVLDREMVSRLSPWPFYKGASEKYMKPLTKSSNGAVKKLKEISVDDVWKNEVAPQLRVLLEGIFGVPIEFDSIAYRLIYVPVHFARYLYSDRGYSFVLNGINGICWGQKPFGIGGISRALLKFGTGSVTASKSSVGTVSGAVLNAMDTTDVYNNTAEYFDLPDSDQFLFTSATGYAELENISSSRVVLRAQWRRKKMYGKTVTVYPGDKIEFGFIFRWCIEVLEGKAEQIRWNVCCTCGGGKKPDTFGMVSPTGGIDESQLSMSRFIDDDDDDGCEYSSV